MTTHPTQRDLRRLAKALAGGLRQHALRIVFAESCTGGLASAALATVPGASDFHCGSAVVYRLETKAQWLGIPRDQLQDPGPVSETVAEAMAVGVLSRTAEADLAVSVTGHLGPGAPPGLDGVACITVTIRAAGGTPRVLQTQRLRLQAESSTLSPRQLRQRRQVQAAAYVLSAALQSVETLAAERSTRSRNAC